MSKQSQCMVPLSEIIKKDDSILSSQMRRLKRKAIKSKLNNLENIIIDEIDCGGFRIISKDKKISNDDIIMLLRRSLSSFH